MKKVCFVLAACAVVSAALVGCGSSSSTEGIRSSSNKHCGGEQQYSRGNKQCDKQCFRKLWWDDIGLICKNFQDSGETIKLEERNPYYEMVGEKDEIMFYLGNLAVKIYQYESVEVLEAAKQQYASLADMTQNGIFILNTNNETAKEIFNSESK